MRGWQASLGQSRTDVLIRALQLLMAEICKFTEESSHFCAQKLTSWTVFSYTVTWHPYLSFSGDGVLKQEVCTLGFLNVVITLGGKQEALAGIVGEGRGRSGGHRLVAGIPAPVPTGRAAVAGRQALLPALTSQICTWTQNTQRPLNYCLEDVLLHIPAPVNELVWIIWLKIKSMDKKNKKT